MNCLLDSIWMVNACCYKTHFNVYFAETMAHTIKEQSFRELLQFFADIYENKWNKGGKQEEL